jgi:tetratricopeptide (TPR) repeat protein
LNQNTTSMSASSLEKPKYLAFISYRHADNLEINRCWATWLHRSLETYAIPPDLVGTTNLSGETIPPKIYPVFRDEEEFSAEASLGPAIREALERSKILIVLCSPKAVQSLYVAEEIRHFKRLGKSDRIIPVLLDGEPGHPTREAFPEPLRTQFETDGTVREETVEPLAADFRLADATEGYTNPAAYGKHLRSQADIPSSQREALVAAYRERSQLAFLKIVAAILAVPLATLTRRDQAHQLLLARKRARIFRTVAAALSVLLAIAVMTGLYANRKRIEAIKARDSANGLVGFMLHDLHDQLSETGRLEVLSSTVEKVDSHLLENPVPPRLVADLRLQQAKILFGQGKLDQAAQRALQTLATLPEDPSTRTGRAKLHAFLGDVLAWGQNKNAAAKDECFNALGLFDSNATDPAAMEALVRTQIALGDILRDDRSIQEALDAYESAWNLAGSCAPALDTIRALARQRKAEVFHLHNNPEGAARAVEDILGLAESYLHQTPNSHPWLVIKAETLMLRSVIERHSGRLTTSLESLRTAETCAEQTATPGQLHRQFLLATIRAQIANHPSPSLTLPQRSILFESSLSVQKALMREDPENRGWAAKLASTLRDHAGFNLNLAELFKDPSFRQKAIADLQTAQTLLYPLQLPGTLRERVETLMMLGGVEISKENTVLHYSAARDLLNQMPADDVETLLLDAIWTNATATNSESQHLAHAKIQRAWEKAEGIRKSAVTLQLAGSHENLACSAAANKDATAFGRESDQAISLLKSLLVPGADQPDLLEKLALALSSRARELRVLGLTEMSTDCYQETAGWFEQLTKNYPSYAPPFRELALAYYQLGKLAAERGDDEKSLELLGSAFSTYLIFIDRASLETPRPPSPLGVANLAALRAIVGRETASAFAIHRYDLAATAWNKLFKISREMNPDSLTAAESSQLEEIRKQSLDGAIQAYTQVKNPSQEQLEDLRLLLAEMERTREKQ